jgi:hypothetical protein
MFPIRMEHHTLSVSYDGAKQAGWAKKAQQQTAERPGLVHTCRLGSKSARYDTVFSQAPPPDQHEEKRKRERRQHARRKRSNDARTEPQGNARPDPWPLKHNLTQDSLPVT